MAEIKFILKVIILSSVIMVGLQLEIHGQKAEIIVSNYLRHGTITVWVKDSLHGAERLIQNTAPGFSRKIDFMSKKTKTHPEVELNETSLDENATDFPDDEMKTVQLNDL